MPRRKLENSVAAHRRLSKFSARVAVITLSTSRSLSNDESGAVIQGLLEKHGHETAVRKLIADDRKVLRATLRELVREKRVQAIITTGGTGLAPSDITIETVEGMLEKVLPGFNALFMLLSYPHVRSSAMLSRALAGTIKGKPVFCLPGSPRACELATEALVLPELSHILMLLGS